ncbi:unnamed protein product, partial [Closterium sp. NIES-54]
IPVLAQLSSLALAPLLSDWDSLGEQERTLITPPFSTTVLPAATVARRVAMMAALQPSDAMLHSITASTLLIASGEDRLIPSVEEAYGLATCIPSCRIKILPFSGHMALLEAGVSLRDILEECGVLLPSAAFPLDPVPPSDDENEPAYNEDEKPAKSEGDKSAYNEDGPAVYAQESSSAAGSGSTSSSAAGSGSTSSSAAGSGSTSSSASSYAFEAGANSARRTVSSSESSGESSGESSRGVEDAAGYSSSEEGEFSMEGKDWDDADVAAVLGLSLNLRVLLLLPLLLLSSRETKRKRFLTLLLLCWQQQPLWQQKQQRQWQRLQQQPLWQR